mmetsp:Transcript_37623/g.80299  ORF Transcript_37623/g.80299 Transcript_37623/m.80299 type:complete len:397 (-) Transcript_37623:116-1306(-)|eukprot:CAMPEP_0172553234 /NCGR_PEP_ID=MMETSP1067-20121228/49563_1 /TAXON_ID=265564 ORGANISM="Thalassiosira punctigera, Strain Tpunct2005C2" /NCGR_SAMPLE_ID=MMETSP1067 /ASSEMBLY_ACC=CAM_ASM_000444 /LENGTH=396 /DNA_ID=CAMNT_0013341383 /DNA_START=135 /DNA_END=1325 /DNA_ORIENTATION=+
MSIVSNLLSVPAFLLFQAAWLVHSLRRPLLLVSALCLLTNPHAALRKLKLVQLTFTYLLFCKDKKWKMPNSDPASFFPEELGGKAPHGATGGSRFREKTLILIRHGESTWNDSFNAGDRSKAVFVLFFIPNLIYALATELYFFVSGKDSESWFFDSALSGKGVGQSEGLRRYLKKEKKRLGSTGNAREERAVKLLLALGEESSPSSHVVSSNLRRAISTAAIGLADRFAATTRRGEEKDPITLIPSLQEISRNPDALTILPPRGVAHPTWCDDCIDGLPSGAFTKLVDTRYHAGNKTLDSNGLIRLEQFCAAVFDSSKLPRDVVIAAGHSLFYRSIFQVYLPRGYEHISKKKKLVNGGTVMVTLREATTAGGRKEYMIDPRSVTVVYGGFGKHTKG